MKLGEISVWIVEGERTKSGRGTASSWNKKLEYLIGNWTLNRLGRKPRDVRRWSFDRIKDDGSGKKTPSNIRKNKTYSK